MVIQTDIADYTYGSGHAGDQEFRNSLNVKKIAIVVTFKSSNQVERPMAINVGEMMSKTLETIQEKTSVQEAAKKMREKDVSSLVPTLRCLVGVVYRNSETIFLVLWLLLIVTYY